jgi:hypothetical protein
VLLDDDYWLTTGRFNVTFNATNWDAFSNNTSTAANSLRLRFGYGEASEISNVPVPASLWLVGIALLGMGAAPREHSPGDHMVAASPITNPRLLVFCCFAL